MSCFWLFVFSFALRCSVIGATMFVHSLQQSYHAVALPFGLSSFNITAKLVAADPPHLGFLTPKARAAANGSLLFATSQSRVLNVQVATAIASGAVGIVFMSGTASEGGGAGNAYYQLGFSDHMYSLPLVELGKDTTLKRLIDGSDQPLEVTIDPRGSNRWQDFYESVPFIIIQILFLLASLACAGLAAWKWRAFIRAKGLQLSMAQTIMAMEVVINLTRAVNYSDMNVSRRLLGFLIWRITLTIPMSLSLITTLLLMFYWMDLTSSGSMKNAVFVSSPRARFRLLGSAALLTCLDLVSSIMHGLQWNGATVAKIGGGMFAVATGLIAISFARMGRRLLRAMAAMGSSRKNNGVRKMTYFMLASAVCMALYIVAALVLITPLFSLFPIYWAVWFLAWSANLGTSFFQILAFAPPKRAVHPAGASAAAAAYATTKVSVGGEDTVSPIPAATTRSRGASRAKQAW